jgi:DNA-binding transcriptional ArsR family regulator
VALGVWGFSPFWGVRGFLVSVTSADRTRITDAAVMRALAHPARLALLEHLSQTTTGATATECAAVVGLSPSATSYHLRALAKVGMIHEAPGRGDARERLWRASHREYDIGEYDFGNDPGATEEAIEAESALVETYLARQNDKVRRFMAVARNGPREWYEASLIGEKSIIVTAEELQRLVQQISELVEPLQRRNRPDPPSGARPVSFQIRAVPTDHGA